MPRAEQTKNYLQFVRGLITEASPLTYPEDTTSEEDNFVLFTNGSRKRRNGIDYENSHSLVSMPSLATSTNAFTVSPWRNVNGNPTVSLCVVQAGSDLYFFDLTSTSISSQIKNGGNAITIGGDPSYEIQTDVIGGRLVVVSGAPYVTVLSYDFVNDVVSAEKHGILTRDIWGVNDYIDIEERPATLSQEHRYNLLNQGWGKDNPDDSFTLYESFRTTSSLNRYPSNADIASVGLNSADSFKFNASLVARSFFGSTPSAKGSFVIDVFQRGLSRSKVAISNKTLLSNFGLSEWGTGISGSISELDTSSVTTFTGLKTDRTSGGCRCVASFSGRLFFSGFDNALSGEDSHSPFLGNYIFFSQIADSPYKLGRCFQEADPTSGEISDVVDTDGGAIRIPEMSSCVKLVSLGNSVVVIAENGVWEISGGEANFTATSISVGKVSSIGAVSAMSVVEAEGNVFYWSDGGIYQLSVDQVSQRVQAVNITERTIQTLFNNIPYASRAHAVGHYDTGTKKVQWMYSSDENYDGINNKQEFDKILILDLVLQAFVPWSFPTSMASKLSGAVLTPTFTGDVVVEEVVVGLETVLVAADPVEVSLRIRGSGTSLTTYLTKNGTAATFSAFINTRFRDWEKEDTVGQDAAAYMVTGYELFDDTMRDKSIDYISVHFERTETGFQEVGSDLVPINPSSCYVSAIWDFANSDRSGKVTSPVEVYRLVRNYTPSGVGDTFDYGHRVITTKNAIRGSGKSVSLKFESRPYNDLHVLGWSMRISGNTV